jgi:hypothetical protein
MSGFVVDDELSMRKKDEALMDQALCHKTISQKEAASGLLKLLALKLLTEGKEGCLDALFSQIDT